MAKKQKKSIRKPSRHHWFLVSVFAVIMLLGITAFVLQRSTNLETIAGEAIRQRVVETKQLALNEDQIKVKQAIKDGADMFFKSCPHLLAPGTEQHWKLEEGWAFYSLKSVDVQCTQNLITCYYADDASAINRADQVVIYKVIPEVENCQKGKLENENALGCNCEIMDTAIFK